MESWIKGAVIVEDTGVANGVKSVTLLNQVRGVDNVISTVIVFAVRLKGVKNGNKLAENVYSMEVERGVVLKIVTVKDMGVALAFRSATVIK